MSETKKPSADIKKQSSSVPFSALKPERILSLIEQALIEGLRSQGFEVSLANGEPGLTIVVGGAHINEAGHIALGHVPQTQKEVNNG